MHRTHARSGSLVASTAIGVMLVAGCSTGSSDQGGSASSHMTTMSPHASSSAMDRMNGGPVPPGMKRADNPRYPVGSSVILTADHMEGMKGAHATVVGAYDTITYAVTFTPTTGGAPVDDHKWVVEQEIKGAPTKRLPDGAKVVLTADHMPGMKGAHATIVSSTTQPVYVVDYTTGGMTMRNHKWVVQDEMRPAS